MKYSTFTNDQLMNTVRMVIVEGWRKVDTVDIEKFNDIDILDHEDHELLCEWHKRLTAYVGNTLFGMYDFMHNVYADWHEFSLNWWLYPGCISMVTDYIKELNAKYMDAWESRQIPN